MLSPEQNCCVELILQNMPEPIKSSPIMIDVADESMKHIMGGDPLESLKFKAIRAVLGNVATGKCGNYENFRNFVGSYHIETFANSVLNQSPEIMMSILAHCQWQPTETQKEAKLIFKEHQITLEVDRKVYLNFTHKKSFTVPEWLPNLVGNLCNDRINLIVVHFEGKIEETQHLLDYQRQFFNLNKNYSSSSHFTVPSNHLMAFKYAVYQGTLCFSAHSKRRAGNTVFAKFTRLPSHNTRDINEIMTIDFAGLM